MIFIEEVVMIISASTTLALYCPYCGNPHFHDIDRFALQVALPRELLCGCGKVQAILLSVCRQQWILKIPCVICGTHHIVCADASRLWQNKVAKIYCESDNLELGLIGGGQLVRQTVADQLSAVKGLLHEWNEEEDVDNPQLMFAVLNRIHDIAEAGGLFCCCGSTNIKAAILPDCIEIKCMKCGGRQEVPAQSEEDLRQVETLTTIELMAKRNSRRNH
jgi:hypothetical protein